EAGMDDMKTYEDSFEIYTAQDAFDTVTGALETAGYAFVDADIEFVPSIEMTPNEHEAKALKKLIDILEENDDVQKVYHNCGIELDEE
ncbi:MAG: YebC/PmpR family DNA-binding transcriptional regulator, partial [Anaerovorax sp.]